MSLPVRYYAWTLVHKQESDIDRLQTLRWKLNNMGKPITKELDSTRGLRKIISNLSCTCYRAKTYCSFNHVDLGM